MTLPRWLSVAALYCLTKSMMLTPCGPSAVPTGGAGVAAPAFSCTLTIAAIFFFLGAISGSLPHCLVRSGLFPTWTALDLADLLERKLHRRLPAADRHEYLELLGIGVYLVHRGRQGREWPVHYRNRLADLEVHRGGPHRLGLLGCLLLRHRREQVGDLVQAQRRRTTRQADETGHARSVPHGRPGLVGEIHPHQDVAGQHLLLHLLALAGLDLDDLVRGDLDLEDELLHVERLRPALQVGPHPVLVARVGMHHIPVARQRAELGLELLDGVGVLIGGYRCRLAAGALIGLGCGHVGKREVSTAGLGAGWLAGRRLFGRWLSGRRLLRCRVAKRPFGLGHDSLSPLRSRCAPG